MKQTLKYILGQCNENLRYAENKHSILAAFAGAIVVFCATRISDKYNISSVFSTIAVIFCVCSILICFLALLSRTIHIKEDSKPKRYQSLLFFKDISRFGYMSYLQEIIKYYKLPTSYKIDNFDIDLAKQIIANSCVTNLKLKYYNLALFFLVLGICFIVTSFVLVVFLP